jgi:uncharacterized protein (UPF0333 family)
MICEMIILMGKKRLGWCQAGFATVIIVIFLAAILGVLAFSSSYKSAGRIGKPGLNQIEPTKVAPSVEEIAKEVVNLLKDKDWDELSNYIHPTKGVRFSPYTFVNLEKDLVFKKEAIETFNLDPTKYNWGAYDGSGLPISLTFNGYYSKFIYDKDFALAKQVSTNKPIGQGNTLNNIPEVYSTASYVEFYIPGSEKMSGMDWGSLRLVFEQTGGKWYLVGVVHDQWTI